MKKEGTALWYEAVAQFLDTALLAGGFVLAVAAGYAVTKFLRGKKRPPPTRKGAPAVDPTVFAQLFNVLLLIGLVVLVVLGILALIKYLRKP